MKSYKKNIIFGLFEKIFRHTKTVDEMKIDILKKATSHFEANNKLPETSVKNTKKRKTFKKNIDPVKKKNIKNVLTILANSGETGVLSKSISDYMNIDPIETKNALIYLVEKKYAEVTNGALGEKYYLSELGRRYCINKKYI